MSAPTLSLVSYSVAFLNRFWKYIYKRYLLIIKVGREREKV